ncbi:reverse transcriptase domain-containing protein [Tanacetum coccineum]
MGMVNNILFTKKSKSHIIIVQIYVDDIIFGSTSQNLCDDFAKIMHDEFEMSMMGELNFLLGLQIKQIEDGIFFNQSKYIKEMLKKFGLEDSKPTKTPMSTKIKLIKDDEVDSVDSSKYRVHARTRSSSNLVGESSPNPTTSNPKRRNRRCSKQPFSLEESPVRNSRNKSIVSQVKSSDVNSSSSSEIAKLTHAVNQQTSVVTTAMTAILKQFQATPPPASVKAVEEICVTCAGAHPYYQCLAADGNTFRDNIQGYVSAAAVNYNQGNSGYRPPSVANQIRPPGFAQPNVNLKALTTRSGLFLMAFVPMPPPFINPEEDERAEETLTDPELAEYTIKEEFKAYLTSDSFPPGNDDPVDLLLEEFVNELALITFPPGHDDLPFDIESDLREIEYLLNYDPTKEMDSILEDSVDGGNLADDLVDTILEMFTDEHTLDYSSHIIMMIQ